MLGLIEAIFLGIVQGLTEFLPVSSSGHLVLGQYFLGLDPERFGLSFDVALHMGTLLAVVSFFWRDLIRLAYAFVQSLSRGRNLQNPDQRPAYALALTRTLLFWYFKPIVRSYETSVVVRSLAARRFIREGRALAARAVSPLPN